MKIEWLVTNVTPVGPLDRARRATYFVGDFGWALWWPIQAVFVAEEPLCDVGTLS